MIQKNFVIINLPNYPHLYLQFLHSDNIITIYFNVL